MRFLIDSSAWIEYLEGSVDGYEVNKVLTGDNEIFVLDLMIAEVVSKVKRMKMDAEVAYKAMLSNSKIVMLNSEIAKESGLLHAEMRKKVRDFGLVDALILTCARKLKARVLTKDKHFKRFKEAVFV